MGSSPSKPQNYYPYPQNIHSIPPTYPTYPAQPPAQYGYYIQQAGNDPSQYQVIPGYYIYPTQPRPRAHIRHQSAPALSNVSNSQPQGEPEPVTPDASQPDAPIPPAAEPSIATDVPPQPDTVPPEAPKEPSPEPPPALLPSDPVPQQEAAAVAAPPPGPPKSELINPLPSLPQDVLNDEPHRNLKRTQTSGSAGLWAPYAAPIASVSYNPQLRSYYRPKRKDTDPVLKPPRRHEDIIADFQKTTTTAAVRVKKPDSRGKGGGPFKLLRSLTMPSLSGNRMRKSSRSETAPYLSSYASRGAIPSFSPTPPAPPVPVGPPISIPLRSPLNPTSPHKILFKKKLYPTAAHLFEAHKFLKHRPELAERIRISSEKAADAGRVALAYQRDGLVRPDWELVWRDKMDEVLYLKFVQHPDLRAELMATGYSQLIDGNEPPRPDGEGVNELGKALMRLRDRLRREGAR